MKKKNNIKLNKIIGVGLIALAIIILLFIVIMVFIYKNDELMPDDWKDNLSYYPKYFMNDKELNNLIIVDDDAPDSDILAAEDVLSGLRKVAKKGDFSLTQYGDIKNLYEKNAIYIGTCDLVPRNKFVNLFADCLSLKSNTAIIKVLNTDDITIVHVIGKDLLATRRAALVLKNFRKYKLSSNQVFVRGTELDNITVEISHWGELGIN